MNCIIKKPLFNDLESIYTGGICHHNYFLFLNPFHSQVLVFDKCLKKIGFLKTEKYQSITENKNECYFILTKLGDKDCLYKTTYDFLEFDSIKLNVPVKYKENINDIYYDYNETRIYIATNHYIYSVTLDGYFIKEEKAIPTNYNSVRNSHSCCTTVPTANKNIMQYTAINNCECLTYSYIKNAEAFLVMSKIEECKQEICLGNDIKVVSIFECCNKLYLLVIKNSKYCYLYEIEIEGKCCYKECNDFLPCCEPLCVKDHCHDKRCCKDSAACILESIALEQTALSHILNAEGEKIQKAIKDDADICELLKINDSVKETIFNTTMLEHVLHQKMEKALKIEECHKPNHCSK